MVNVQSEASTSHYRITTVTSLSTTAHLSTPREVIEGPLPGGHYVGWTLAECWLILPACSLPPICVSVTSNPLDWFVCPSWRLQWQCQTRYHGVCKHGVKESVLPIFRAVGTACQKPAECSSFGRCEKKTWQNTNMDTSGTSCTCKTLEKDWMWNKMILWWILSAAWEFWSFHHSTLKLFKQVKLLKCEWLKYECVMVRPHLLFYSTT